MLIPFVKYQGTGNDFIMIDDRAQLFPQRQDLIERLCHRRFGIGADGLILFQMRAEVAHMVYFNSDGRASSMCGNGGRCFAAFGSRLGALSAEGEFLAVDGPHPFSIGADGHVSLRMKDVQSIVTRAEGLFVDTGSPHIVLHVNDPDQADLIGMARAIRYNEDFKAVGVNVNLIAMKNGILRVRTYERGVEDETYSCGTGVTAAALAAHHLGLASESVPISTKGGPLAVRFRASGGAYSAIDLIGPAEMVFDGVVEV
jgi:diaminopimelate epimerase